MATASDKSLAEPRAAGYWVQARQPLTSLLFVSPLLVAYEAGVILLGPAAMRNGAEVWLRQLLDAIGFGAYFLLPILTVSILLGWHHTTHGAWHVPRGVLYGMAVESILLASCLRLQAMLIQGLPRAAAAASDQRGVWSSAAYAVRTAVGYLGAGIYEELLFRLIFLSLVIWALRGLKVQRGLGLAAAIIFTSLVFSAAHYVGPHGETIRWFSFGFRWLAGTFFALLYVYRGFGIAVGAHAGYDILVSLC